MKKIVFICSHQYSGSEILYQSLNRHPRIQGYKGQVLGNYSSGLQLLTLTKQNHKCQNRSAIYMDEILFNFQISSKDAYKYCKFIYVLRKPEIPINFLIYKDRKKPSFAVLYYKFRVRRLCEMAKRTPGAIFLTYEQLCAGEGMDLIKEYLDLPTDIEFNPKEMEAVNRGFGTDLLGLNHRLEVERTYERYLYFLRNLPLRRLP